jgi:predicted Zn-dependent protease
VLDRALGFAKTGDFAAAEIAIHQAVEQFGAGNPFIDELCGTVLAMKKDYAGAEKCFAAMIEKLPKSYVARFNLAEMVLLQGHYERAESAFAFIELSRRPVDPAFADLCRFKRVICLLAKGAIDKAEALLPSEDPQPSSPAVQYSRASILHAKKDAGAAANAIEQARKDFEPDVENLFVDSFIELGWGIRDAKGQFAFVK